jgi:hypothetical protein
MLNIPIEHYLMQKLINNVQNVIFATRFNYLTLHFILNKWKLSIFGVQRYVASWYIFSYTQGSKSELGLA